RHPVLFWIWFEFSVARLLRDLKPDLFLSPDGYLPLSGKTKKLAVIHDLNFVHNPTDLPWMVRMYYNYFFPRFAAKAKRIATVSRFSKSDLIQTYRTPAEKIDVVYNGADPGYRPLPESEQKQTRVAYTQGHPYFLFVGSLHPRKNIGRLLQAFALFKQQADNGGMKLVLAGHKYWWTAELETIFKNLACKDDVLFTGRVAQTELYKLVASATALTYIPTFEGFGIPVLEAMNCDVPVLASNTTSLPEVCGNAALLVDPYSTENIASGMNSIVSDNALRIKLTEAGRERRKVFTWDRTAELLWESIEKTVRNDVLTPKG
ncbi:MAG TPA: glycosyltransferase family 1 protein, partial [Bacteroidia bacterium]|nr:glycosyltransferase family 1 protein [Bacteroidia bacterium]